MTDLLTRAWDSYNPEDYDFHPEIPSVEELLEGYNCPQWLVARAKDLSESPYSGDQARMVGLVGRLASAEAENPRTTFCNLLEGKDTPGSRARKWAEQLSEEECNTLWLAADNEIYNLYDDLSFEGFNVQAACIARDEIESLLWVIRQSDEPPKVDHVDNLARALNLQPIKYSEHLGAVGWQEPHHWWGYQD